MRILIITLLLALTGVALAQAQGQSMGFNYQTVVRDGTGQPLLNQQVRIRISLLKGDARGPAVYVETHRVTTNNLGIINLTIGRGSVASGSFATINWSSADYYIKVEVDRAGGTSYSELGVSQLLSVPFANYAFSGNEGLSAYQVWLSLGNTGTEQDFINSLTGPAGTTSWTDTEGSVSTPKRVGIGTSTPGGMLQVVGNSAGDPEAPLFEVKNRAGETVFAIYEDRVEMTTKRVEVNIDGDTAEGKSRGGFAVSGRTSTKAEPQELLVITPQETRFYVDEPKGKSRGGFAVSGRTSTKGDTLDLLHIVPSLTTIYVDEPVGKSRGGFAVSGRTSTKGVQDYLTVTPSLTQVWVDPTTPKSRGGFAVSGRTSTKSDTLDMLHIVPGLTTIYVDEPDGKSRGGFAVSGRTSTKGIDDIFTVTPSLTQIYVDTTNAKSRGGFAVSGRTSTKAGVADLLWITPDFTRVYVDETGSKSRGGFAVSGRTSTKAEDDEIFMVTPSITQVFVSETASQKSRGGFAVSGRTSTKSGLYDVLTVKPERTDVFIRPNPDPEIKKAFPDGFSISVLDDQYTALELFNVSEQGTLINSTLTVAPRVSTASVFEITSTSAKCSGSVTADGNSPIIARGIVYSTTPQPSLNMRIAEPHLGGIIPSTPIGDGMGSFTVSLSSLTPGTTYYVRTYATNEAGLTGYGDVIEFKTL